MREIVPDNWNTYCDGKEGTVMGRNKWLLSSENCEHVPNIFFLTRFTTKTSSKLLALGITVPSSCLIKVLVDHFNLLCKLIGKSMVHPSPNLS